MPGSKSLCPAFRRRPNKDRKTVTVTKPVSYYGDEQRLMRRQPLPPDETGIVALTLTVTFSQSVHLEILRADSCKISYHITSYIVVDKGEKTRTASRKRNEKGSGAK